MKFVLQFWVLLGEFVTKKCNENYKGVIFVLENYQIVVFLKKKIWGAFLRFLAWKGALPDSELLETLAVKIVASVQLAGEENLSTYRHGYPGKKQNTKIALKNLFLLK